MTKTLHRSLSDLQGGLDGVRQSPADSGVLTLIVRRPEAGAREVPADATLDTGDGLVGDNWRTRGSNHTADGSAHPDRQLTIMNSRAVALVCADPARWPLAGDQLYVDLDLRAENLPAGTRLVIGEAELEVTPEPHTGCGKFVERFGVDAMKLVNSPAGRALNLRGVYAKVVRRGVIRVGDAVTKLAAARP
jgi:MOSC domain-containing protein YiiM